MHVRPHLAARGWAWGARTQQPRPRQFAVRMGKKPPETRNAFAAMTLGRPRREMTAVWSEGKNPYCREGRLLRGGLGLRLGRGSLGVGRGLGLRLGRSGLGISRSSLGVSRSRRRCGRRRHRCWRGGWGLCRWSRGRSRATRRLFGLALTPKSEERHTCQCNEKTRHFLFPPLCVACVATNTP